MSNFLRLTKGFTLLEILLVLGITITMAMVTFLSLSGFRVKQDLDLTSKTIVATLRDAQNRAIIQEEGESWGVRFSNLSRDTYSLFIGPVYFASTLNQSIKSNLQFADPLEGTQKDILFEKVTGYPSGGVTQSITISVAADPMDTKIITIYSNGRIEIQ